MSTQLTPQLGMFSDDGNWAVQAAVTNVLFMAERGVPAFGLATVLKSSLLEIEQVHAEVMDTDVTDRCFMAIESALGETKAQSIFESSAWAGPERYGPQEECGTPEMEKRPLCDLTCCYVLQNPDRPRPPVRSH